MTDGTVEVEGVRFSDVDSLKLKLAEVQKRQPRPRIRLDAEGTLGAPLLPALDLLQQAGLFDEIGIARVGFVTEPKPIE